MAERTLEPIYSFVFLDAIHYKIREDGHVLNRAAYVVIGVDRRDKTSWVYGLGSESSKFWLGVLNELKSRGVEEIFCLALMGLLV